MAKSFCLLFPAFGVIVYKIGNYSLYVQVSQPKSSTYFFLQLFLGESPEMSTFAGGEFYHDGVIRLLLSEISTKNKYYWYMYEQRFQEDILFCMLYAGVAVMAILKSGHYLQCLYQRSAHQSLHWSLSRGRGYRRRLYHQTTG